MLFGSAHHLFKVYLNFPYCNPRAGCKPIFLGIPAPKNTIFPPRSPQNMAINVNDHEAVPEDRKLEEDEIEEVLEKFDAELENLPKIERTDAALKSMDNVEVGDVIEIRRDSPTAGKTTYYRRVIER